MKRDLFKPLNTPYYLYSFDYDHTSGGNVVMHYLCHALNLVGETAYMFSGVTNPNLKVPLVNKVPIDKNFIAVYPETIVGNKLEAMTVVRYVLYYPGVWGGDKEYDKNEVIFAFSNYYYPNVPELTLPIVDTTIFYEDKNVKRDITTFYVGKSKGCTLNEVTRDSVEIARDATISRQELANLLRRSKVFYSYVITGIVQEALCCGTPVVMLPNEKMSKESLSLFNEGGIVVGVKNLKKAKATVQKGKKVWLGMQDKFWVQLDQFIEGTQKKHQENLANYNL